MQCVIPVQPGSQIHCRLNNLSTQIPFSQGLSAHKSILISHRLPLKPAGQEHLKSATKSVQVAPNRQGRSAQSSANS